MSGPEKTFRYSDLKISRGLSFGQTDFVETMNAVKPVEDWSECRSIPRAKRRHAKGIKTRRRIIYKPTCYEDVVNNKFYIHPDILRALRKRVSDQIDRDLYSAFTGAHP